ECVTHLYDVLAPARFVSRLVNAADPGLGFAVANTAIVAAGLACYFVIRAQRPAARTLAWVWIVLELANGIGHVGFAIRAGGYFPGVLTAPLLIVVAASLAWVLLREPQPTPSG